MVNPVLAELGLAPDDRAVIFHIDDLGMCHSTLEAWSGLLDVGLATSASIMAPCPWAQEAAVRASARPEADVGAHLTITSEWRTYRWGPLTGTDPGGLTDPDDRFWATTEEAREHASSQRVADEIAAQLSRLQRWDVDLTHADWHMGAIAHPRFMAQAVDAVLAAGVWPMIPGFSTEQWSLAGLSGEAASAAAGFVAQLRERGIPTVDHLRSLPLAHAEEHAALTLSMLADLPPGITHFYLHPCADAAEIHAISPDSEARVANFEAFADPALLKGVRRLGIVPISYRPLRDLMRKNLG